MPKSQEQINQLLEKLEILLQRQETFSREIHALKNEIHQLSGTEVETQPVEEPKVEAVKMEPALPHNPIPDLSQVEPAFSDQSTVETTTTAPAPSAIKANLEKFIGENLINKIGIAITIIGVGIGARYAIENQLISPLTRIVMGYLVGLVLLGFALKLKSAYENFSSVLLSGAMAILYFITFAAYSFYDLIPQLLTFALMFVFTAFTVFAALQYNRQVIALIGLVGAYAVPFLLSDGSGQVAVLYSYMAIINGGILIIAILRYWKPVFYAAFTITWLIYASWYSFSYKTDGHFALALTFLSIFFAIFYTSSLVYKLRQSQKFAAGDIILMLSNAFIFYGFGYAILNTHDIGAQLLGLFTLVNAVIHFAVGVVIYRQKLGDRSLFYLVTGLVLLFITIAIPVQLDGNWVTMLWAGQAALLFWVGRSRQISVYEILSYPLIVLAFLSLAHDWEVGYSQYQPELLETKLTPLFNIQFLTSLFVIAAFSIITYIHQKREAPVYFTTNKSLHQLVSVVIPSLLLLTIFISLRLEIANYFNQIFQDTFITVPTEENSHPSYFKNYDILKYQTIWLINYAFIFLIGLMLLNVYFIKDRVLGLASLAFSVLAMLVFLTQSLFEFSELRESYLNQSMAEYYTTGLINLTIRYISFIFPIILMVVVYKTIRQQFIDVNYKKYFDYVLHLSLLWILSSELIHWMDLAEFAKSYKLGLSILWGIYALFLIAMGISLKKKYLRISAIVLFSATLLKLFFYDISHLDTIAKTIVFVSLGVLLLIISFLYNKYRHIITDDSHE